MQTNLPYGVDDLPLITRLYRKTELLQKGYRITYETRNGSKEYVGVSDLQEAEEHVKDIQRLGHKIINVKLLKSKVYVKNPSDVPQGKKVEQGPEGGYYYESEGQKPPKQKPPEPKPPEPKPQEQFTDVEQWEKSLSVEQRKMVQSWQFVGYDFMRKADKENRLDEGLGILKEALKTAPSYHGVLYRGIRHDISTNIGDTISLNAISSFSISKAVASNFSVADPANGKYISPKSKVTIFSVDLHKSSRQLPSKAVGGTYEQEAIFLKNTKFRVKSIEPVTIKRPHAQWKAKIIHLEEI